MKGLQAVTRAPVTPGYENTLGAAILQHMDAHLQRAAYLQAWDQALLMMPPLCADKVLEAMSPFKQMIFRSQDTSVTGTNPYTG